GATDGALFFPPELFCEGYVNGRVLFVQRRHGVGARRRRACNNARFGIFPPWKEALRRGCSPNCREIFSASEFCTAESLRMAIFFGARSSACRRHSRHA